MYIPGAIIDEFDYYVNFYGGEGYIQTFMDCVRNIADRPEEYLDIDVQIVKDKISELVVKFINSRTCNSSKMLLIMLNSFIIKLVEVHAFKIFGQRVPHYNGSYSHYHTMIEVLKSYIVETNNYIPDDKTLESIANEIKNEINKLPKQYNLNDLRDCASSLVLLSTKYNLYYFVLAFEYMEQRHVLSNDSVWIYK